MSAYQELKAELESIAAVLDKFPETVKPQAFELLVSTFLGAQPKSLSSTQANFSAPPVAQSPAPSRSKSKRTRTKGAVEPGADGTPAPAKPSRKVAGKESYKIDGSLNLRGNGASIPSFKEFVGEKKPLSATEFNAVSVYYLEKIAGIDPVNLNHVFTCYHEASQRPPEHFKQSFNDTKNKKGWITLNDEGLLTMQHRGDVFVQHDLPKKGEPAKTKR